jgi:hypothetical protein
MFRQVPSPISPFITRRNVRQPYTALTNLEKVDLNVLNDWWKNTHNNSELISNFKSIFKSAFYTILIVQYNLSFYKFY